MEEDKGNRVNIEEIKKTQRKHGKNRKYEGNTEETRRKC